jgi:hypothetical protein
MIRKQNNLSKEDWASQLIRVLGELSEVLVA